jgi:hypothetical protein
VIEAALRALDGDPASLVATMTVVVAIVLVVVTTYHQLIGRFPTGAGGPKSVARSSPDRLRLENRFLVAHWGVFTVLAMAAAMILAAGGDEQKLVQFYAVSVFASFLAATLGCARLNQRDGKRGAMSINLLGAALVAVVLALNLTRLDSAIALAASLGVALYLWRVWVSRGRPDGIIEAEET